MSFNIIKNVLKKMSHGEENVSFYSSFSHVLSISHAIVLLDMHHEEMGSVLLRTFDELKLE